MKAIKLFIEIKYYNHLHPDLTSSFIENFDVQKDLNEALIIIKKPLYLSSELFN